MILELNPSIQVTLSLLHKEGNELLAIIVASLKTLRSANRNS